MRITIVTVYNSENSGSFLQAYALEHVLSSMGHEVRFLHRRIKGTSHYFWERSRVVEIVYNLLKLNFKNISISLKRWFLYQRLLRYFNVCDLGSDYYNETEIFIIGSDTIWNFDDDYFISKAGILTGFEIKSGKVITYAASAANTPVELFVKVLSNNGNFERISNILVRDSHTADLVKNVCNKPIKKVCDPTLLCPPSFYDTIAENIDVSKPYLLLYYAGSIELSLQKAIIDYAKTNNLIVISMMNSYDWCDKTYVGAPQYFIPLFKSAAAVVTNTFHGCVFSIIYNKPFAVKDDNKNKVNEILIEFDVQDHIFKTDTDFLNCINIKWKESTSLLVEKKKKSSLQALCSSI